MQNLKLKLFLIIITSFVLFGCSETKKKTEAEYLDAAKASYDNKQYDSTIMIYTEFIKNYPQSDKAIFAYNQIAGIYFDAKKDPTNAIKTYQELAEKFPNTKEAKQSLFMVAFIYDETLKDKENAKKAYKYFLEKFPKDNDPNDKMSESARTMLEVLESGKSIEDIIQKNLDKSEPKTDSAAGKKEDAKVPPKKSEDKKKEEDPAKKQDKDEKKKEDIKKPNER